jgi:hypothetical protein
MKNKNTYDLRIYVESRKEKNVYLCTAERRCGGAAAVLAGESPEELQEISAEELVRRRC